MSWGGEVGREQVGVKWGQSRRVCAYRGLLVLPKRTAPAAEQGQLMRD